jgi:hypothetical protein
LIRRNDGVHGACLSRPSGEIDFVEHRGVKFDIDMLGIDVWRWTIHPREPDGFRRIGQFRGPHDAVVAHCKATIDESIGGIDDSASS